jgi:hypothetical protein
VDLILNSHIFSNPISQECHEYWQKILSGN